MAEEHLSNFAGFGFLRAALVSAESSVVVIVRRVQ